MTATPEISDRDVKIMLFAEQRFADRIEEMGGDMSDHFEQVAVEAVKHFSGPIVEALQALATAYARDLDERRCRFNDLDETVPPVLAQARAVLAGLS